VKIGDKYCSPVLRCADMDLLDPFLILLSLIVGFLAGYAVRSYVSYLRHRRSQWR